MFTLNIGTDIEQIMIVVGVVAWIVTFLLCWRILPRSPMRTYFLWILALIPAYWNLKLFMEVDEMLSPFGVFDMWFRHAFYYAGQLMLFLFVWKLFSKNIGDHSATIRRAGVTLASIALFAMIFVPRAVLAYHNVRILEIPWTLYNILLFLTDEGVPHILAFFFLFVTIAFGRIQASHLAFAPLKNVLNKLFIANFCFILLHLFEFFSESLHFFPTISHPLSESMEGVFVLSGLIAFYVSARALKNVIQSTRRSRTANVQAI